MWAPDDFLDSIAAALRDREADLRDEHAVHGLDALAELEFHTLLAASLASLPHGVLREQPYPHEWRRKHRRGSQSAAIEPSASPRNEDPDLILAQADPITGELPDPRDRMRCDLVLTPSPGLKLGDPLTLEKSARTRRKQAADTLFAAIEAAEPPPTLPADTCPPEDAYWLEIKLIGQFTYSAGIAGPNATYASELLRGPAADLKKLSADGRIVHAASLILLFTHDLPTAEHDLAQTLHRCLDRNLPIGSPISRSIPIADRIGNQFLTLCLVPLRAAR